MAIAKKLTPMTPYQVFLTQVAGVMDGLRSVNKAYIPPQFGGPLGQRSVIEAEEVLSLTSFKGESQ